MNKLENKLDRATEVLTDLKSILEWAKDHNVGLGEIVELLSTYDHYTDAIREKRKNGYTNVPYNGLGDFEEFIHDMITLNITEVKE